MSGDVSGAPVDNSRARRGRPKSVGLGERRRAQLTEAAFEVFAEFGYEDASVSLIAKRAGMGQGTLYRYVQGKRELLDLVVDMCIERVMEAVAVGDLIEAVHSPGRQLADNVFRQLGERLYRVVDDDPRLLKILTAQVSAVDREFRYRITGLYNTLDALVVRLISEASERGWLTVDDHQAEVLSRTAPALGIPGTLLLLAHDQDSPERRASFVTSAARIERHGILRHVRQEHQAKARTGVAR